MKIHAYEKLYSTASNGWIIQNIMFMRHCVSIKKQTMSTVFCRCLCKPRRYLGELTSPNRRSGVLTKVSELYSWLICIFSLTDLIDWAQISLQKLMQSQVLTNQGTRFIVSILYSVISLTLWAQQELGRYFVDLPSES